MPTHIVIYREDWWLPHRTGFTQYIRQPLDAGRSLLVTLSCSSVAPQPRVQDAGIYVACEHPDGPFWSLIEPLAPAAIVLATDSVKLQERAVG